MDAIGALDFVAVWKREEEEDESVGEIGVDSWASILIVANNRIAERR